MRLTETEIHIIKHSATDIFGSDVAVFLFGSRVDDTKKGGDIDLYIKTNFANDLTHKIKFLVALEHIDQFLFRFSKLQDAMGEKLFVSMLEFLQEENPKSKPFIDTLNRLEQIGLLEDKNTWLELRKISNNIAHQYEDEPKQASEALNAIYAVKPTLESIYQLFKTRYMAIGDR